MEGSLKHKTVNGVIWSSIERFSVQGVNFALGLIIARLLTPSDYGTIAMLGVFTAVASAFVDSGFSSALIRKTNRTESDNSTVFYFNMVIGLTVYIILFLFAGMISDFFKVQMLKQIIPAVALVLILNSLCLVQQTILTTNIDFKTQARVSVISVTISGILGVAAAYWGLGVWALVIQMVVASTVRCIMLWVSVRWWPSMPFSKSSFRELFSFGSKLLGSSLVVTFNQNFYTLVLGKVFSQSTLGVFNRANQTAAFPASNIVYVVQRVTFPVMSTIQNEEDRLCSNFLKVLKVTTWLTFPLMAVLCILSKPIVLLALTAKWSAAIAPLQVLCIALAIWPVFALSVNILTVRGRSGSILAIELIKTGLNIGLLFTMYPLGLLAVCWGQVIVSGISLFVYCFYIKKNLNLGIAVQLWNIIPNMAMASFSSLIAYLSINLIDSDYIQIVVGTLMLLTSYGLLSYRYNKEGVTIIRNSIKHNFLKVVE